MGLFSKYTPPERTEGRYGSKSGVPETITAKQWDRLHPHLPFPADDIGESTQMTVKRIKFGHQRFANPGQS